MSDKENDVERSDATLALRRCPKCQTEKPLAEFYSYAVYCKPCSREYSKAYYRSNKEKLNEYQKQHSREKRLEVLKHYGGDPPKCECCGETTVEFLGIDHLNTTGHVHREEIGTMPIYLWIIKNGYPPYFRVLCHNCNLSQGFYGYCPHKGRIV